MSLTRSAKRRPAGNRGTANRGRKMKAGDPAGPTPLVVDVDANETNRQAIARKLTGPFTRHSVVIGEACARLVKGLNTADKPDVLEYATAIKNRAEKAATGDVGALSELLMVQALTLDNIFSEYARIALISVANHVDASERYMRLALKAQAGSRATLVELARLHSPREQTVRHVHVNEGGQAIVAEEFHNHATGGVRNGETDIQSHEPGGATASGPALQGKNPGRDGVPVPETERPQAMQVARGQRRRSEG